MISPPVFTDPVHLDIKPAMRKQREVRETSVSPTNCSEPLHTQLRLKRSGNTLNCRVSAIPMLFDRRDRLPHSRLVNIIFRKRGRVVRDLQLDAMTSLARFAFTLRRHIIAYCVKAPLWSSSNWFWEAFGISSECPRLEASSDAWAILHISCSSWESGNYSALSRWSFRVFPDSRSGPTPV